MPSRESVINAALHHIGEPESPTPLTDDSTWVARIRNRLEERSRAKFEGHNWNFAMTVQQLTATEPTPEGWAFGFQKPGACLSIKRVAGSSDPRCNEIDYDDRGGRICTNSECTFLHFVDSKWLVLFGSWPQVFADDVAADLAMMVGPTTNSAAVTQDMLDKKAAKYHRDAKNWNATQTRYQHPQPSKWQVGRFSSGGRGWRC